MVKKKIINLLPTERQGNTGAFLPSVEERPRANIPQYRPRVQLISTLLLDSQTMNLPAFEDKKYTTSDHCDRNVPCGKIRDQGKINQNAGSDLPQECIPCYVAKYKTIAKQYNTYNIIEWIS